MDDHLQNAARAEWNAAAADFDEQPDHGLRDPAVRQAWAELLTRWLPPRPAAVLDLGCGTGSLSVLLAELGHTVTGIDFSVRMIELAQAKARAAGLKIDFRVMDAGAPELPPRSFDVLLCRHLLWALPEPGRVLERWAGLLRPGGRLVLVEGMWHTGAGMSVSQIRTAMPPAFILEQIEDLSRQPLLWGGPVRDERYAIAAVLNPGAG